MGNYSSLATIPLQGVRAPAPVEMEDPQQQMVKMAQLLSTMQQIRTQQATAPLQIQQAQYATQAQKLQTEALQRQQDEHTALTEALGEVGGDFFAPGFAKAAVKKGVSATTLAALQKQLDDSIAAHSKRKIEEINLEKARNTEIADLLDTVKDPASFALAVQAAVQKGYMSPAEAAEVSRGGYDPDTVKRYATLHRGANGVLDRAVKEQQLQSSKAAQASSEASAAKTKIETEKEQLALDAIKNAKPEEYERLVDQIVPPNVKENAALNARTKAQVRFALQGPDGVKTAQRVLEAAASEVRQLEVATDPRVVANKVLIANKMAESKALAGGLVPRQDEYEAGHKFTVDEVPLSIRPQVENALKYQSALPPQSRLNPAAQAIRWWTMSIDPNYSEELFPVRKAAVLRMNTGKDHDKLNAMNTVLGHVGRLEEAVDALQNGDIRALNGIANELGVATGSVPQVVFRTIVHRVGPELTQAYVGSGGEASERKEAGGDFDLNGAPDQIKGSARITAKLLASKMGSTLFDFKRAAHFDPKDPRGADLIGQFFTPEAIHVMDRMFPGWKTEVEPGAKKNAQGKDYIGKIYQNRDKTMRVQYTADGKLWNIDNGKEVDPTTGKEK